MCDYDSFSIPIIKKTNVNCIDWDKLSICGVQNLSKKRDNSNSLIHMFLDDKKLLALWNNPLKKIALFRICVAIATPDFSIYPSMNYNDIRHNIYMNRWLGCTWQNYGNTVIPNSGGSEIIVEDDGSGFNSAGDQEPHIALNNIRQRLEMMCKGRLEISPRKGGGTSVKVTIPASDR